MAGYGIELHWHPGTPLRQLPSRLQALAGAGFTHVEMPVGSMDVVINGGLHPIRKQALLEAIQDSPVRFTVHGTEIASSRGGNLMDVSDPLQLRTVLADIDFAEAIGAKVVVYHAGTMRSAGQSPAAVHYAMEHERKLLRAIGDYAAERGIVIAVENRDPVTPYLERHVYALRLDKLAEQIEAVNHPNVGICFDTGHAWLSAAYLEFDYLEGVRRIAPLVNHIHLSDNFGQPYLDQRADPGENLAQGLGDLHLPPGWGTVPFEEIATIPFPRNPVAIVEMRESFLEHATEIAASARAFAKKLSG